MDNVCSKAVLPTNGFFSLFITFWVNFYRGLNRGLSHFQGSFIFLSRILKIIYTNLYPGPCYAFGKIRGDYPLYWWFHIKGDTMNRIAYQIFTWHENNS